MPKLSVPMIAGLLLVSACASSRPTPAQPHGPVMLAADEKKPRAVVTLASYRFDDILWENDRTAHRIYGKPLEAAEPPSGSGIDAWGKRVRWPYMDRQLRTGDQHTDHGEGMDFYDVGGTRGTGGLGIWHDNKLWVSRNWFSHRILATGGDTASFEVDYAPWPVDTVRNVWESRRFTLPMGSNFTRMVSTIRSDKPGPLIVGIGIAKKRGPGGRGEFTDLGVGRVSYWEPEVAGKGVIGVAVMVDPTALVGVRQDADHHLVLIRVEPGKPFVYYMGATWDKGLDFADRASWETTVKAHPAAFSGR